MFVKCSLILLGFQEEQVQQNEAGVRGGETSQPRYYTHIHTYTHIQTYCNEKRQMDPLFPHHLFYPPAHILCTYCQRHLHNICSHYTTHLSHPPLHSSFSPTPFLLSNPASSPPLWQESKSTWTRLRTKTRIRPSTSSPKRSMLAVFTLRGLLAWVSLALVLKHTPARAQKPTHMLTWR